MTLELLLKCMLIKTLHFSSFNILDGFSLLWSASFRRGHSYAIYGRGSTRRFSSTKYFGWMSFSLKSFFFLACQNFYAACQTKSTLGTWGSIKTAFYHGWRTCSLHVKWTLSRETYQCKYIFHNKASVLAWKFA